MEVSDWRDFSTKYASSGGRIENYGGWVHRQFLAANTSVVNKARKQLTDPVVQNMMVVMGGELPDYMNKLKMQEVGTPAAAEPLPVERMSPPLVE